MKIWAALLFLILPSTGFCDPVPEEFRGEYYGQLSWKDIGNRDGSPIITIDEHGSYRYATSIHGAACSPIDLFSEGKVEYRDGWLVFSENEKNFRLFPLQKSGRVYLISDEEFLRMVNGINDSKAASLSGGYNFLGYMPLTNTKGQEKCLPPCPGEAANNVVASFPTEIRINVKQDMPPEYVEKILSSPVSASVVKIEEKGHQVSLGWMEKDGMGMRFEYKLTLDRSKGFFKGMVVYSDRGGIKITEVNQTSATGMMEIEVKKGHKPTKPYVGMQVQSNRIDSKK